MGDNKISEAAVNEPLQVFSKGTWLYDVTGQQFTAEELDEVAFLAYSPHLQGEAVPVAWIDLSKLSRSKMVCASAYQIEPSQVPVFSHPQPAELSEVSGGSGEVGERQSAWNDSARLACLESWAREPGGLLLHAESGTGRRGLGLGENCGRRTLAQAIDSCATHAEKDSFAALAATGKQQVGENQIGDATNMVEEVQGVDLGKVRSSISAALGLCVICAGEDAYSRGEVRDFGIKMHGEFAKTLALIDGRDAGTGVGNIQPPTDLRTKLGDA